MNVSSVGKIKILRVKVTDCFYVSQGFLPMAYNKESASRIDTLPDISEYTEMTRNLIKPFIR